MKYTFKNGSTVIGTLEEITKIGRILGEDFDSFTAPKGYYASNSRGLVKIVDMHDIHLKNAINKIAVGYYEDLRKQPLTPPQYVRSFLALHQHPKMMELLTELHSR